MTFGLLLKYEYILILLLNLRIPPQYAFERSITKCPNKRITCLNDVTFRFCFNTASFAIIYGKIKHCPKFTACSEDERELQCVKQESTKEDVLLPTTKSGISSTKTNLSSISSIIPFNSENVPARTEDKKYSQFITTKKPPKISFASTVTKPMTRPKKNNRKDISLPTTSTGTKNVTPATNKKSKPTIKNSKFKNPKHKNKTLLASITKYLIKLKRKYHRKKKPIKKPRDPLIKLENVIRKTSKKPLLPFKNTTKKPINKRLPTKPVKVTHKINPSKGRPQQSSKTGIKKPEKRIEPTVTETGLVVEVTTPILRNQILNKYTLIDTTADATELPAKEELVNVKTSTSRSTTSTSKATAITTETLSDPSTVTIKSTMNITESPIPVIKNNSTESGTTESAVTSLDKNTSIPKTSNTTLNLVNITLYTPPPFPCAILEKLLQYTVSTSTTTVSSVTGPPSTCNSTAKYPAKKCNEYYECKKVMWWHRMFTLNCKKGEAFDATTLNCVPDLNCLGI